jgi:hypothetical protein
MYCWQQQLQLPELHARLLLLAAWVLALLLLVLGHGACFCPCV